MTVTLLKAYMRNRIISIFIGMLALAGITYLWINSNKPETQTPAVEIASPIPVVVSVHAPEVLPLANSPLKASITSAGDYLVWRTVNWRIKSTS
ncbi:MAG: hypothetical protein HYU84_03225 [Chloroflexi bacterium]|nr:hypothetical protein [Chloroflexota bacterium]